MYYYELELRSTGNLEEKRYVASNGLYPGNISTIYMDAVTSGVIQKNEIPFVVGVRSIDKETYDAIVVVS